MALRSAKRVAVAQTHAHTHSAQTLVGRGRKKGWSYRSAKATAGLGCGSANTWSMAHLLDNKRSSTEAGRPQIVRPLSTLLKHLQSQQPFVDRHKTLKTDIGKVTYSFANTSLSSPQPLAVLFKSSLDVHSLNNNPHRTFTPLFAKCWLKDSPDLSWGEAALCRGNKI